MIKENVSPDGFFLSHQIQPHNFSYSFILNFLFFRIYFNISNMVYIITNIQTYICIYILIR